MANSAPLMYDIYVNLRPRNSEAIRAFDTLEDMLSTYPGANVSLVGLGRNSHHTIFCIDFSVPVAENDPSAISALQCIHAIFTSLFDFVPCYTGEPTDVEKFAAEQFISHRANLREQACKITIAQELLV